MLARAEILLLALTGVVLLMNIAGGECAAQEQPDQIGPVKIRFYSGNLSVSEFMAYWGTAAAAARSGATPEQNALLKRCSVTSMCDYITWALVEKEKGVWDWSLYDANQKALARDGIGYNVFAWLHFPPKWFEDDARFIRYKDLATGNTIPQLSLWAPYTLELYDEFYRRLASQFGGRIGFLRLAMPSEYGEIGYCTGMTNWLRPQPGAAPGYWCADAAALGDFRTRMLAEYGSLENLNRRWGTDFAVQGDIAPPDVRAPMDARRKAGPARVRWLDFADWYNESWTRFTVSAVKTVRRHFPKQEIIVSLGYGAEDLRYGNDQSRHIAAMARAGVAAQTPGDVGYFATRRVSSACRTYGVPYYTEPPGDVPRDRQVSRIFMDASNGTETWFDYPQNLDRARDLFVSYKQYLTGEPPRAPVALWLPTLDHWLHPEQGWPRAVSRLADELRDLTDYEVVDDLLVADGALEKLHTGLLVLVEPRLVRGAALKPAQEWVEKGGILLVFAEVPIETDESGGEFLQRVAGAKCVLSDLASGSDLAGYALGKGRVLAAGWDERDAKAHADAVAAVCKRLAADGKKDLALVDGVRDGVWMTSIGDRVLMLNTTVERRAVTVRLPGGDIPKELAPRTIAHAEGKGGRPK